MAIQRKIQIDDKQIEMRASAATLRRYRAKFGRDLLKDLNQLNMDTEDVSNNFAVMEVLENLAYIMAKQADPTVSDDVDEWLDQWSTLGLSNATPQIVNLWQANNEVTVPAPKNKSAAREK